MSGAAEFFEELRREYLAEAPARLGELRKDLDALGNGEPDAAASLKVRLHRLAGSGGSYGFPEISTIARTTEQWLGEHPKPDATGLGLLRDAVGSIATMFDHAAEELGLPISASPPRPSAFGWQALIVGPAGDLLDQIGATLRDAQFTVTRRPSGFALDSVPVSERPDLAVVIGTGQEETSDVVARWAFPGPIRPGAVVLVGGPPEVDPLSQPFASLDAIIPADRVEYALLGYARALGRAVTAPRSVLVVDPDQTGAIRALASSLEGGSCRVAVAGSAAAARPLLLQEAWDLVVVEWRLADTTPTALIRWIHQLPRRRLAPVVVLTTQISDDDRLTAIRAGAEDVLLKVAAPAYLAQCLLARIDRTRTIRAVAHRDDLTGLLNHEAIGEELERAIAVARRANEAVAVLLFDIDHFRRVNEVHGQVAGDQVLVHVSRLISGTVRSSDVVARMGGEEFGVLVRRCSAEDALRLAEKVRAAVAGTPTTLGNREIPVRLSAAVAGYPAHGAAAQDILRAADKALLTAKNTGRDRVVPAGVN